MNDQSHQAELPVIDSSLCIACGACIAICPDRILQADKTSLVAVTGESCLLCGHCQALCPVDAIAIPALVRQLTPQLEAAPSGTTAGTVSAAGLIELMQHRRSCRLYEVEPVPLALLKELVQAGISAPSGTNCQAWQFVVLPRRSDVERLAQATARFYQQLNRTAARPLNRLLARLFAGDALGRYYRRYYDAVRLALEQWHDQGIDRLFHGAPAALIVAADQTSSCPAEDSLLATQNILLVAEALGLGTCLIGFVVEAARRDRRIAQLLQLREQERIYSVIACGYPAVSFKRPAGRKPAEPRVVTFTGE